MKIISSYGVELRKQNIPIRQTLEIYRSAVRYLVEVYESVWEELAQIENSKKRFNAAEHLVHTTKRNPARFDFDFCFPKMPSYFRRAAVQHALGSVSSYRTRLEQWKAEGQKTGKPYLKSEQYAMPVFYHDVMYRENTEEKDAAFLKLYDGHDWKWFAVRLKHTDMEYLRKHWSGKKASAPTLEKKHDKYFLRFTYAEEVSLNRTPVKEQTICSVDLGINTDAVCTIMRPDGTILGRKFINFPSDKDRMYRVLGRIRRFQREHGSRQVQGKWAYAKRLNTELGRKIAKEIVFYASENKAESLISYAKQFIGNKYVWGGTSLTNGTDCSGFTLRVFQKFGYSLPRTSAEQAGCGSSVKLSELKPGDLVFYKRGGRVHHVAIYIGGGQIVHAAGAKWGIITSNMNYSRVSHARRILK